VHKFAVVPEVMEKERWLATRGNPSLLPTDDPAMASSIPARRTEAAYRPRRW
jgi:hypothetical protein